MNLTQYTQNLLKFLEENPEAGALQVITAMDEEGDGYSPVHYEPSVGYFTDEEGEGEFWKVDDIESGEANSVCVN